MGDHVRLRHVQGVPPALSGISTESLRSTQEQNLHCRQFNKLKLMESYYLVWSERERYLFAGEEMREKTSHKTNAMVKQASNEGLALPGSVI